VSQVRHGASGSGGDVNVAEEVQVSASHRNRSRRAELTLSSLIQTLASQRLSPSRDRRRRRAEVAGNAHASGDRGRGDQQFSDVAIAVVSHERSESVKKSCASTL
jgi:hypothetical protein